jgi:hypothetical protein
LGPAYIKLTVSYCQNPGSYGQSNLMVTNNTTSLLTPQLDADGDIQDSKLLQGTFVVGANFNPAFGIEAGVGYGNAKVDAYNNTDDEIKQWGYLAYIQFPITLAKGFRVIPELGTMVRDDFQREDADDVDQGSMTYFDVNFRVDF